MTDPWLETTWTRDDLRHVEGLLPQTLVRLAALNIGLRADGDAVRTDVLVEQRISNAIRLIERELLGLLTRQHTRPLPTEYDTEAIMGACVVHEAGLRAADENDLDTTAGSPSWSMAVARAIMVERKVSGGHGGG